MTREAQLSNGSAPPPTGDAWAGARPGGGVTVEQMSEASFPASDPPATWTWDVSATARAASARAHARESPTMASPGRTRLPDATGEAAVSEDVIPT